MSDESPGNQVADYREAIGQTAELVESLMMEDPPPTVAECGQRILDSLRGSGLEIDGPAAKGRIPGAEVGASLIRAERLRQVAVEGYDEEHDAGHRNGSLSRASLAYALHAAGFTTTARYEWPFDDGFKPGPKPLDDLVKAGALALAEADRVAVEIDRIVAEEAGRDDR